MRQPKDECQSVSHLTGARRATPPRAEAAALTTLTEHDAAPSAASTRAAMLLLVLIGVACRGQARGDEPRAERARHGRHCPSPGAWLPLTACWIPPTRSGRTGHSDSAARAPGGHATPRTAEGENPEHDEMRGGRPGDASGAKKRARRENGASGGGASISRGEEEAGAHRKGVGGSRHWQCQVLLVGRRVEGRGRLEGEGGWGV